MTDGPRILIVDDEPNIRDLLTTSLRFALGTKHPSKALVCRPGLLALVAPRRVV